MAHRILVTGGAGYVGCVTVPKLLEAGHEVVVYDLLLYGDEGLSPDPRLRVVRGDLRDTDQLALALRGCDSVLHLACISNDPSFELDPALGKSINYDAFRPLVELSQAAGVGRFVYASSSSVYGVKQQERVTEDLPLDPLTDYSRYKALCEDILQEYQSPGFTTVTVRPATVCGYSPRLRLDLTVNILTNHAVTNGRIRVFGGDQYRPNIHIDDLAELYVQLLALPADAVAGRVWNAGYENQQVRTIAEQVRTVLGDQQVEIVTEPTDDPRSYRITSEKIRRDIGFEPRRSVEDAIRGLVTQFRAGKIPNSMTDPRYFNIRTMQQIGLH